MGDIDGCPFRGMLMPPIWLSRWMLLYRPKSIISIQNPKKYPYFYEIINIENTFINLP